MAHNYSLMISGIVPRPIGLTSTISAEGKANLAPLSYFQIVDHDPPVFMLAFSGRGGALKDTLRNLRETGEVVLNTVSENMIEAVNATSVDAPPDVSKWVLSGLTKGPSTTFKPARVMEAVFSIETKLLRFVDFDTSSLMWVRMVALLFLKQLDFGFAMMLSTSRESTLILRS